MHYRNDIKVKLYYSAADGKNKDIREGGNQKLFHKDD